MTLVKRSIREFHFLIQSTPAPLIFTYTYALFASFEGRGRKGLGGEGKGRKRREKAFPLFGS